MKKKQTLASLLAVGALVLSACGNGGGSGANNDSETVNIGVNVALSGDVAAYGTAMRDGAKLAADEINANGGVLGKQINLVEYDNQGDDAQASQIATRLATEDGVSAIIGSDISSATKAAIQVGAQVKVPVVGPAATADSVTETADGSVEEYGYRVGFSDSYQGSSLARFADENLGAKKAIILGDNSTDYAVGLTKTFTDTFSGEVVGTENYTKGDTDFSAALTNLANKDFDVLFIPGYYEQGGPIIKQAREMGIEQPILGPDGFANSALTDLAGASNMNDVYYTTHFTELSEDPKVDKFVEDYEKAYSSTPDSFSALAYDSLYMVVAAIERAGTQDSVEVNKEIAATKDFEGVTGTFSFDDMHNPVKSVNVIEMQDGKPASVTEVEPVEE